MNAIIITIGDEILIGQIMDTNSVFIASVLTENGITVIEKNTVSDNPAEIEEQIPRAMLRAGLVIITGGLGPTSDDRTKSTLCKIFNTMLVENSDVLEDVKGFVARRSGVLNDLNRKQAAVPACATVLRNPIGTAPGLWMEKDGSILIALPGVPFEMEHLMVNEVLPRLKSQFKLPEITKVTVLTTGISEARLAELLSGFEQQLPQGLSLAYLPSPGIIRLRLLYIGLEKDQQQDMVNAQVEKLKGLIPEYIFGFNDDTLQQVVGRLLVRRNETVSAAESCTGGAISSLLTSVAGSSRYYTGSIIAYDNTVKIEQLKVDRALIQQYGAVSKPVAEQMAAGCCKVLGTGWAVATTGIAGPDGGSPEKPVGTVWIAVAHKSGLIQSARFSFGEHRGRNIQRASVAALNMLRTLILQKETDEFYN